MVIHRVCVQYEHHVFRDNVYFILPPTAQPWDVYPVRAGDHRLCFHCEREQPSAGIARLHLLEVSNSILSFFCCQNLEKLQG